MRSAASLAPRRPTILIIMDGIGHNPSRKHNGVALANTPKLDDLYARFPTTVIETSGPAVGLPDGQMGNSEVGHITLGSGQIVRQDLVKINDAIADGSFLKNQSLLKMLQICKDNKRPLHLLGLVSDGGVHSHLNHIVALINMAAKLSVKPVLHMFTDGRDTSPKCANRFLDVIEPELERAGGSVITIIGRYFAMDRDNRWDRVELAWKCIVQGQGRFSSHAKEGVESAWAAGQADEFIKPIILPTYEKPESQDQFLFFNYRNDRPRELTQALALADFEGFDRGAGFKPLPMTTMTEYDSTYHLPIVFHKETPDVTLGELVSNAGIKQFHSAETEKYPHVTFFFNGGREEIYEGEERNMVASPKVATYDLMPEMSAYELAEVVMTAIRSMQYGFIVCNFANGDMVGHTGVQAAIIKAVEVLDDVVGSVIDEAVDCGYSVVLTADHGNADLMVDPKTGFTHTQHTNFPVPCLVADKSHWRLEKGAGLSAIAPTILQLMGLEQPPEISGRSLLIEKLTARQV